MRKTSPAYEYNSPIPPLQTSAPNKIPLLSAPQKTRNTPHHLIISPSLRGSSTCKFTATYLSCNLHPLLLQNINIGRYLESLIRGPQLLYMKYQSITVVDMLKYIDVMCMMLHACYVTPSLERASGGFWTSW